MLDDKNHLKIDKALNFRNFENTGEKEHFWDYIGQTQYDEYEKHENK